MSLAMQVKSLDKLVTTSNEHNRDYEYLFYQSKFKESLRVKGGLPRSRDTSIALGPHQKFFQFQIFFSFIKIDTKPIPNAEHCKYLSLSHLQFPIRFS